jgi:NO-binding membrane sensor protein with MHYT domain
MKKVLVFLGSAIPCFLFLLFAALDTAGVIEWDWFWVILPILIYLFAMISIAVTYVFFIFKDMQ